MTLSFLIPNRTVLLVSDEALQVYTSGSKGVEFVETIPWDVENFEENVATILSRDCGGKPVLVLNDMVEQHYRKERIPRAGVGVLDKANMLKRKLNVAFPNYPVRAAYPLKEKLLKTEKRAAADVYIFAAIPNTAQFSKTLGATSLSLATISAFCLLPVEASDMVKTLSDKISKKDNTKPKWTVFIGQHKNGSLRQIVTKNGELALTRMTPVVDSDADAVAWAREVHQEFKATMSYISRFGYQPEDGLNVIVICSSPAGRALDEMIDQPCNFNSMTVIETAKMLGLPISINEDVRHADILHVLWTARKSKFILAMKAVQIDKVSRPRQAAVAASFLLFCGAAFLLYQLVNAFSEFRIAYTDIGDSKERLEQLNVQYQKEVKRKEEMGFDVRLVQSSIAVHDELKRRNVKLLQLFRGLSQALGKDLRVDAVTVDRDSVPSVAKRLLGRGPPPPPKPIFEARMQMTYPSTTDIDKGNEEVKQFSKRLNEVLPGHTVEVTKFLKDYEYVEQLVVETGDLKSKDVGQDYIAEILVRGPLADD